MKQARIYSMVLGAVGTNCYIAVNETTKKAVVVDPADHAPVIVSRLSQLEAEPEAVLLTHGHFDHIGAAEELQKRYGIPVYIHKADEEMAARSGVNMSAGWATPVSVKADQLYGDGDQLTLAGLTFTVLHTPGHTPGSCCLVLYDEKVVFSGDTLFYCSIGRTDFPGSSASDMRQSLAKLMKALPDDMDVLPGHGEFTRIDFEKRNNPYV